MNSATRGVVGGAKAPHVQLGSDGLGHFVDLNSDPASVPLAISSSPMVQ